MRCSDGQRGDAEMGDLNHLNDDGDVHMVDIGGKAETNREAVAEAFVTMKPATAEKLFGGQLEKGDALATVRIAAIQATKQTPTLIPLCHPIALDRVEVTVERSASGARIEVRAGLTARTGVEMEAMVGAGVGALTLYDMIKGIDRSAEIEQLRLLSKSGGRSGVWTRD